MELNCDKCGAIDCVLVDGYPFGDRMLEGVMFIVKDENGKPRASGVVVEQQDYFDNLNQSKWLRACEEFCEDLDVAECPKCGEEVVVWGNPVVTGIAPPAPKVISMTRGSDLLGQIFKGKSA